MLIGEKIRNERKVAKMSQEELSEQIGVSLKTVQRWEACERSPRVEQVMQISKVFGVKPEYFLRDMQNIKETENAEINLLNETDADHSPVLFFKSGDKEVKLPDTDNNRKLFLQVVEKMLAYGTRASTIDSSINVNDGRESIYNGSNIAV